MTTDKTIDGVPRELAERFAQYAESGKVAEPGMAEELRGLLDAPACRCKRYGKGNPHWPCPVHASPPAQHQVEPTEEMKEAGCQAYMDADGMIGIMHRSSMGHAYRAMRALEQPAPVADPLAKGFTTLESDGGKYKIVTSFATRDDAWSAYRALVGAKPAPVAVVMPDRDSLRDVIAQAIGGDAYDCVRVWSAWGVGTMSEDNFVPVVDQEARLYEIADACLDELNRLNPSL